MFEEEGIKSTSKACVQDRQVINYSVIDRRNCHAIFDSLFTFMGSLGHPQMKKLCLSSEAIFQMAFQPDSLE